MKYLKTYQIFEARLPKPKTLKKSNLDKIEKGLNVGYVDSYEIDDANMTLTIKFVSEVNEPDYVAPLDNVMVGNREFYSVINTDAVRDENGHMFDSTDKYNDKMFEVSKRFIKANKNKNIILYKGKEYPNKDIISLLRHNSKLMQEIETRWDYHPYATNIEAKNGTIGFLNHKMVPSKEGTPGHHYRYKLTKSGKLYDGAVQPIVIYNSKPLNDFSDYEKALQFLIKLFEKEIQAKIKRWTAILRKNPTAVDRIPSNVEPFIDADVLDVARRHKGLIDRTSHIGIFDLDSDDLD